MAGSGTAKAQRGRALARKLPAGGKTEARLSNFGLERVIDSLGLEFWRPWENGPVFIVSKSAA